MSETITTMQWQIRSLDGEDRIALQKNKGLDIPFEYVWTGTITGTASSGNIRGNLDFGSLNSKMYYYITNIFSWGSGSDLLLWLETDRWELFHADGIADQTLGIWVGNGNYISFDHTHSFKKPFYLGRPRNEDADAGVLTIQDATNTESVEYIFQVHGFASKNPIPLSTYPDLFL